MHKIIFSYNFKCFKKFISAYSDRIICILVDSNTKKYCLELLLNNFDKKQNEHIIEIKQGEKNKNIHSCLKIWKQLSAVNADRKTLLINLGGGVLCDMGGFAASAYKRGIDFIHVPTTLLAMVDASIGGKTAVNMAPYKNQIGLFSTPKAVFINPIFLKTLPAKETKNAYAEILKHALIKSPELWSEIKNDGFAHIEKYIKTSIKIKSTLVMADEKEAGLRKNLNFGHTLGHALEMLSDTFMKSPLKHGEAVAAGIICESYISSVYFKDSNLNVDEIGSIIKQYFPLFKIDKKHYENIYQLMEADKKNIMGHIKMVLIKDIGDVVFDMDVKKEIIFSSLDYYNNIIK